VRWETDGHVSLLFPSSNAIVEHHGRIEQKAAR
jgi:Domain of unknown function (DUF1918)